MRLESEKKNNCHEEMLHQQGFEPIFQAYGQKVIPVCVNPGAAECYCQFNSVRSNSRFHAHTVICEKYYRGGNE